MTKNKRDIQRKLRVPSYAEQIGDISRPCRYFGIGRASFYRWKAAFQKQGEAGLVNKKTIPKPRQPDTP
jgi:transposase